MNKQNNMNAKLLEDILSYNYKLRGKKGEEVKIISQHGDVYIVEKQNGERFSVHKNKLQ